MTSEIDKLKHFHVKNKHIGNCPDCVFNKYLCYTHLFGYLNPYYRSAYNIPKRRK